jgi:hypothetical protein
MARQCICGLPGTISLRNELSLLGLNFAATHGLLYERSDGQVPSIVFGRDHNGRHGNFHPLAYQRIEKNARWGCRLERVHTH